MLIKTLVVPILATILSIHTLASAAMIGVIESSDYKYPIISISGEITNADGDRFSAIASRFQHALVEFNSPGGNLLSGIQIGTVIRLRAFHTLVRNKSTCASSCAYAWLAGTERYLEPEAGIGFHAAYVVHQGSAKESGVGNALLGSYLSRIALSDAAIVYFTSAPPHEINWLNSQTALKLGLKVHDYSTAKKASLPPSQSLANVGKSPLPTSNMSMESKAAQFIKNYFSYWSADGQLALKFLDENFDDTVLFYGKQRSKRDILKEKISIIKRWPARAYIEQADSLKITCNQVEEKCSVSGIMDWEVSSEPRNKRAAGVSEFTFFLDFSKGHLKVIAETGSVLQRRAIE